MLMAELDPKHGGWCASSEARGSNLEIEQKRPRKIIHIDMDAFYASLEQRDDPALRGKPVAVGGSQQRGVVAAASYEARKFGVRSAMPTVTARCKCPDLIFVKPRFDVYKAVSLQVRAILAEYTAMIEPLSLDEAYLDVTENHQGIESATEIAERIRSKIRAETQLTACQRQYPRPPGTAGHLRARHAPHYADPPRLPDGQPGLHQLVELLVGEAVRSRCSPSSPTARPMR
jgi:DNA polymerase-4